MRIDNQQQQNKGVMDLMPQTGAVEEKNGIQMFADAVKTESSKKSAGTTSFQAKEVTYLNPAKEEKKTVIDEIEQSGSMDAGERKAQMAVLAETTSPEDYERMQEDGFSLDDTTSNKIVTVTDKIKAQLDDYVVGQEYAKKAMSVAVYNHYKLSLIHISEPTRP